MQHNMKRRGFFSLISPFLVYFGVSVVVEVIAIMGIMLGNLPEVMELAGAAQDGVYTVTAELTDLVFEQYMQHLTLVTSVCALCVIPVFYLMFRKDNQYEKLIGFAERKKAKAGRYLFILVLGIAASIGFNNILLLSRLGLYSEAYQSVSTAFYEEHFLVQLLGLGLAVPVAEEFMFRGIIFRRISYMTGTKTAIWLSALVFGIYHGNLVQGIYGFVMGFLFAWLYDRYGSMKAPVLMHITANLVSVIATETGMFTWIFQDILRIGIVTVVCAAAGSAIFVVIQNRFREEKDVAV